MYIVTCVNKEAGKGKPLNFLCACVILIQSYPSQGRGEKQEGKEEEEVKYWNTKLHCFMTFSYRLPCHRQKSQNQHFNKVHGKKFVSLSCRWNRTDSSVYHSTLVSQHEVQPYFGFVEKEFQSYNISLISHSLSIFQLWSFANICIKIFGVVGHLIMFLGPVCLADCKGAQDLRAQHRNGLGGNLTILLKYLKNKRKKEKEKIGLQSGNTDRLHCRELQFIQSVIGLLGGVRGCP